MIRLMSVLTLLLLSVTANAHKPSDSYLTIEGGHEFLTAHWDIALKDLQLLIGLDDNNDGKITWGELKAKRQAITTHTFSHLAIRADGQQCKLMDSDLLVDNHTDGAYAVIIVGTQCPGNALTLDIQYSLLFDADPTHRGLLRYTDGVIDSTHVLSPEQPNLTLKTSEVNLWTTLRDYLVEGIWHIWIGYDHILFLLMLLLPAVLVFQDKRWRPVEHFRPALIEVLKLVTAFTIAHSITLSLAVLQVIELPSRLVESVIALSIAITALNNIFPVFTLSRWWLGFGFGLVHGFGFASVLLDLGLSHSSLAVSLLGFNLGVEVGQIALATVFFPLAFIGRGTSFYRNVVVRVGSVSAIVISSVWVIERAFNQQLLNF